MSDLLFRIGATMIVTAIGIGVPGFLVLLAGLITGFWTK
jgi:hypothetical protein